MHSSPVIDLDRIQSDHVTIAVTVVGHCSDSFWE